jgi:ferric-dicitrate binding protein FerR (iron transport regulator)
MWKILQRYITDNCSPDERRRIEQWMDGNLENRQLLNDLEQIWESSPEEEFQVNVRDAWDQFRARKMKQKRSGAMQKTSSVVSDRMLTIFRAAAAILLVAFVGFFSWQYPNEQKVGQKQAFHEQMQDIKTQKGEKAQISFSDGTVVTLNTASSLRYPKKFDGSKREVYLSGEAYFEVAPNAEKPFIVHTSITDVEVLGTKFNIRAWEEDAAVNVGVREGEVAVHSDSIQQKEDKNKVLLTKGQYTSVIKGKGISEVTNVDVDKHLLWLNGGMYFDDEPFSRVIRQLERQFNIQITINDTQLLDVPFTGTFQQAELEEILNIISVSMGIEYRQEGFDITFRLPDSDR